jgi:hypothetical protein
LKIVGIKTRGQEGRDYPNAAHISTDYKKFKNTDQTGGVHPFDRDRFPGFFGPAVLAPSVVDFFLRMPRRLSEGYSHLMERRWH